MASVLVVYSSYRGQTRRIAERIGAALRAAGHSASVQSVEAPGTADLIGQCDAAILGGAIRIGRHSRAMEAFARAHAGVIAAHPNAFFSVSLSAAGTSEQVANARRCVDDFVARTGWRPRAIALFAGALPYREYNPFLRLLMRFIVTLAKGDTDTSRNYEYTDWAAVDRFASSFASALDIAAAA